MDVDTNRTCEVEVSYGGEADLHEHLNSCEKNPGHQNFVPVDRFSMEHLPSDYRNNDLLDLIRVMSDLTVRVSVKYVSDRRPKTWPGRDDPYPFHNGSHRSVMRTGTGWVYEVTRRRGHSGCSCCNVSSSSNIKHGKICVRTAAHVVYDEQEGQHTICHLFFDKGGTPDLCPGVVALTRTYDTETNTKQDRCQMNYITCDMDLIERLKTKLKVYKHLERDVILRYFARIQNVCSAPSYSRFYREKLLCVIVSHPHGCSKQVSVGYCTSRSPSDERLYTRLKYTTPTCPGSSGARIFLLGNSWRDYQHVHSGNYEGIKDLNQSSDGKDLYYDSEVWENNASWKSTVEACRFCLGDDVLAPTLLVSPADSERQGPWEVEVSYGGETELHQRYDTCEKNPGHHKCIPVDQFNEDHLPFQVKDPELLDLIRVLSDLTVRVSVKSVSNKRPEDIKFLKTCSGDEQPDSCYRDSSRNMMLTGTGCVAKVIKYENSDEYRTCSCKECQMSQTPKTEFAQIYIRTAIPVVYDNFEAEHSTCDFFFDRGHTPDTCPGAVTLSGVSVEDCKQINLQYLICITHDLCLADRMTEMVNKFKSLPKIIMNKNIPDTSSYNSSEVRTVILVSHPHGSSKMVSVGYQSHDRMTYMAPTCSGSTGAHFLSLKDKYLSCYTHIGKCEFHRDRSHGERVHKLASALDNYVEQMMCQMNSLFKQQLRDIVTFE